MSDPKRGLRARITQVLSTRRGRVGVAAVAALTVSTTAFGLPWDTDMFKNQAVDTFDAVMPPPPEGVVAQPHVLSPRVQSAIDLHRNDPEAAQLRAPFPSSDESVARGERMYEVYCWSCHGEGADLGPVADDGRMTGIMPVSGPGSTMGVRSDGFVYLLIRDGGAIMPSYGWAMSDEEMWSTIHYLRTLPNNRYLLGDQ